VIDYENGKEMFCMDSNGTYKTTDKKLIAWMKKNKPHIKFKMK
jgi:hypothetical protein